MEPIKRPFHVSLVTLGVGLLLLALWAFIPAQEGIYPRFLHGIMFGTATLLISTGGFAAFCIGSVYLVNFFMEPRVKAQPGRSR